MRKKVKLFSLFLVLLSLFCCKQNPPFSVGDKISNLPKQIHSVYAYYSYIFFEYKKNNYVVLCDGNYIADFHFYSIKEVQKTDFEKIKTGMFIYEAVELVGLPFFSENYLSRENLIFKTSDGKSAYLIGLATSNDYFNNLIVRDVELCRELKFEQRR